EQIACLGQSFHSQDFDWSGGRSFFQLRAAIVEHGANLTVDVSDHKIVAGAKSAVLYQNSSHRTASTIKFGFEHDARCRTFWSGPEFLEISNQANHFHQQVEIRFL